MTKDKLERLGERAIACAGWRWVEGMMTMEDQLVVYVSPRQEEGAVFVDLYAGCDIPREVDLDGPEDVIPNLVHPTTSGAMLALVRAAWKDDTLAATYHEGEDDGVAGGWDITAGDFSVLGVQVSTEAEALLLALEFAPGFEP
tara:strand:- start:2699 stop:3127 length:429 start_codon:yes stop_codon:yes gene_type:complete